MEAGIVLGWVLGLVALWVAGLPLAALLFGGFPDRGASLALPTALAVLGLVTFWVGQVRYGYVAPLAGAGVVLVLGVVAAVAGPGARGSGGGGAGSRPGGSGGSAGNTVGTGSAGVVRAWLRPSLGPAVVFCSTFGLLLAVRFVDPSVVPWGGEKFLDYGLVRSILRAESLPPEAIWFAGEPVRYYYGGQLVVATLARLTATPARFAYNLGLATAFGTFATAVYGVGSAATAPGRRRFGGSLAVLFAVLGGHLATPARALVGAAPRSLARDLAPVWTGIRASPADALDVIGRATGGQYGYWPARHVIPGVPTAFPMWTFMNGDLRAHMLAAPFVVLAVAVALAYYRTPADRVGRRRALVLVALPAVAGLLGVVNTWSLPVALGVGFLALVHAPTPPRTVLYVTGSPAPDRRRDDVSTDGGTGTGGRWGLRDAARALADETRRAVAAGVVVAVAGVLAVAVASPFLLSDTPANEGIALVADRSGPGVLALAYGAAPCAFLLAGLSVVRPTLRRAALVLAAVPVAVALTLADLAALWLVAPIVAVGWIVLRRIRRSGGAPAGFVVLLAVAGAGLLLAGEFVYAQVWPYDPNAPRWNTMYKISMDLWPVWGIGAGAALATADRYVRSTGGISLPVSLPAGVTGDGAGPRITRRHALRVGMALLVVSVAAFPALALDAHFVGEVHPGPGSTLDAHAWAAADHDDEMRAIEWLDRRAGTPTVLTRPGRTVYTWHNAPSTFAGLPTVVGWYHEAGYRGEEAYRQRLRDVERIYTGPPGTARRLLEEYGVRYVYVGPDERDAYAVRDPAAIPGVYLVYENDLVEIYAVEPDAGLLSAGDSDDVEVPDPPSGPGSSGPFDGQ